MLPPITDVATMSWEPLPFMAQDDKLPFVGLGPLVDNRGILVHLSAAMDSWCTKLACFIKRTFWKTLYYSLYAILVVILWSRNQWMRVKILWLRVKIVSWVFWHYPQESWHELCFFCLDFVVAATRHPRGARAILKCL